MSDTEKKNRTQQKKLSALRALDALDKEFPSNPGQISFEGPEGDFEKIFDETLQNRKFKAGQVVEGTIIKVTDDHVVVDINYKSEGVISRSEFRHFDKDKQEQLEEGQKVDVYIEQIEDKNGVVVLSKDKANIKKVWQNIIRAKENDEVIQGKVVSAVKGGLSVDIGIKAFLPGSQIDTRPVRKLDSFVGQTLDFKIIKMNFKRGNIVLSRKPILEKEREKLPGPAEIREGAIVKGIVKNITDYGAFVDLGNRDGLLHITDMSWSRIEHPSQILQVGQKLSLKILKYDMEKNRISLGMKQLHEEKWEEAVAKCEIGSIVKGKVSSIVDYGAFISLSEGLEGLAHINELSWTKKIKHPSHILKVGDELNVKIIDIKKDSRKLSLSIKQTQKNPWLKLKDDFAIGDVRDFEVVSVSDFGIFVKVNDMIDGLVRVSDISWTENINPFDKYKVGDKVQAQILDIDPEGERFSLGIKQLQPNPWLAVEEQYPIGSRHEVKVIRIMDFGVFVQIQENIEGLIHISELSKKRVDKPQDIVKVGDQVTAEILSIDKSAKKIALSIRLVESDPSPSALSKDSRSIRSAPRFMENFFAKALKKSMKIKDKGSEEQSANSRSDSSKEQTEGRRSNGSEEQTAESKGDNIDKTSADKKEED